MADVAPDLTVGDITTLDVDAIVNAANTRLAHGGGVCGAIHTAAGSALADACAKAAPCPTGDARITPGFDLVARYVIHAVGPVFEDGRQGEPQQLASCYQRSLELAEAEGLGSIAFPCISTGIYGYPPADAAMIALDTLTGWLRSGRQPSRLICCCFSEEDAHTYRNRLAARHG